LAPPISTATSKIDGLRLLISNHLIAEARYQQGMPLDTNGWNFVLKRGFDALVLIFVQCDNLGLEFGAWRLIS
jgi:hypothetical protein